MPNWVYNTVVVSAPKLELEMFLREMEQPRPEAVYEGFEPTGEIRMSEPGFSFWNVVAPPAEHYPTYFQQVKDTDSPYYWYSWNLDNWGCKWDCGDGDIDWLDDNNLRITFQTPWDYPRGVVSALAEQYPHLEISWSYEEEQGWGGELTLIRGEVIVEEEYDIPDSHADYEKRGNECYCEFDDDPESWYADCPRSLERLVAQ